MSQHQWVCWQSQISHQLLVQLPWICLFSLFYLGTDWINSGFVLWVEQNNTFSMSTVRKYKCYFMLFYKLKQIFISWRYPITIIWTDIGVAIWFAILEGIIIFSSDQQLYRLIISGSIKTPHSLAATVFALGGWNLAWRSVCVCVCVCVCVFVLMPTGKKVWQWEWPVPKRFITSEWIHVTWTNFVKTHTFIFTFIGHGLHDFSTLCPKLQVAAIANSRLLHHHFHFYLKTY